MTPSATLDALLQARLAGAGREALAGLFRSHLEATRYAREFDENAVNRDSGGRFVAAAAGAGPLAGAAKVASYIPVGSLAYIAYSTADDPLSVWRAARKAVAGPDKPAKQRPRALPSLEGLSERFAREFSLEWDHHA